MGPDEAKALAKEFDFSGEIICHPNAKISGVGPGRMLIVKAPGDEPRMGRGAAEYLRELLPYLSAKQERAIYAVRMIAGGGGAAKGSLGWREDRPGADCERGQLE